MPRSAFRHSTLRHVTLLAALLLIGLTQTANAQKFFSSDATIDYFVNGNAYVGYGNFNDLFNKTNGVSPSVSLVDSGDVAYDLSAYNSSLVTISGGGIGGDLYAEDSSRVNVRGGSVAGALYAAGDSRVSVSDGSIGGSLSAAGTSRVIVSGGSVGNALSAYDSSRLTISGGITGAVFAYDASVVNFRGGIVNGDLNALNGSVINVYGTELKAVLTNPNVNGSKRYTLSGKLTDGTSVNGKFLYVQNGGSAKFTLINIVSRPSVIHPVVGMGGKSLIARKRLRRI